MFQYGTVLCACAFCGFIDGQKAFCLASSIIKHVEKVRLVPLFGVDASHVVASKSVFLVSTCVCFTCSCCGERVSGQQRK